MPVPHGPRAMSHVVSSVGRFSLRLTAPTVFGFTNVLLRYHLNRKSANPERNI